MSSLGQLACVPSVLLENESWFAIQTRPRHEKRIAQELTARHITTFLPLVTEMHHWCDRTKRVQVPLFSCYTFVAMEPAAAKRLAVLRIPGVLGFVGRNHEPTSVPQADIDNIQAVLASAAPFSEHPFLKVGQTVRVRGGALDGVEGILTARSGERGLVISIEAIQRSLAVRIDGYEVEPV